jgi:cytochrome c
MTLPQGDKGEGRYIVRAAYTDRGSKGIPGITAEKTLVLRNAKMPAGKADKTEGVMKYGTVIIASVKDGSIGFNNFDLTGITQIAFTAAAPKSQLNAAGGYIEVRLDSPTGKLLGQTEMMTPTEATSSTSMPPPVVAKLSGATGTHDVYYVFKNDNAPAGQALFVVIDLEFQTDQSAMASAAPAKATTSMNLAENDLAAYVGKYKMSGLPFETIEITLQAGKLHISAGGNEGDLKPGQEADVFEGDGGSAFKFGRNPDKKVTSVTLQAQGFSFEGTKE